MVSTNVRPYHYDLMLKPDLKALKFEGKTNIKVKVLEETKEITLNAVKLQIGSSSIAVNGKEIATKVVNEKAEDETVTFVFEESIAPGEAELDIEFSGELNDKMKGKFFSLLIIGKEVYNELFIV